MDENQKDVLSTLPETIVKLPVSESSPRVSSFSPPPAKRTKIVTDPPNELDSSAPVCAKEVVIDVCSELQSKDESNKSDDNLKCSSPSKTNALKTPKKNVQYNLRMKKTPQKRSKLDCSTDGMDKEEFENEIDELLEEQSWKNNLSALNVKNILRHVITNEHVLAMVRNTMKEEKVTDSSNKIVEEAVYEPKLTRSKAKELIEKNANVPWPISPIKKPQSTCKIMETEFSEEENSSDEEYTPEADEETDLDKSTNTSQLDDTIEKPSSPVPEPSVECEVEKKCEIDEEILPFTSIASLTESFEQLSAGDTIACRTRSKLPMTDTPLESIESSFIAPDITTDMYDSECDDEDWMGFLNDFVGTPFKNTDVADDENEDPEYNFLEDNEVLDREDLRDDRAVKITKKELSELMAELFEAAEMELEEFEDDDENSKNNPNSQSTDFAISMASKVVDERDNSQADCKSTESLALIGDNERRQLDEQMRKHVQLLIQGFILSSSVEEYQTNKETYLTLLIELQAFAIQNTLSTGRLSAFNAWNLTDGVALVTTFNDVIATPKSSVPKKYKMNNGPGLSQNAKGVICNSKVLIYPELLPQCGFSTAFIKSKVVFSEAEDNLLAMGMEQFSNIDGLSCHEAIREHMLPTKTEMQIKHRIKNLRLSKAPDNPVKYYFQHKKAPPRTITIPEFNPSEINPPKKQSMNLVPNWIRKLFMFENANRVVPIVPKTDETLSTSSLIDSGSVVITNVSRSSPTSSGIPFVSILRTPEKNPILPAVSNNRISPLKQISPILKKYRFRKIGGNIRKPKTIFPNKLPVIFISPMKTGQRKIAPKDTNDEKVTEINTVIQTPIEKPIEAVDESVESNQVTQSIAEEEQIETQINKGNKSEELSENFQETDSQSDVELFDDEEEPLDNAEDLAALMAASTTIQTAPRGKQGIGKRCSRLQRDTHAKLQLLASDLLEKDPLRDERETAFAQSYLLKVKEVTKNDEQIFEAFLKVLYEFGQSERSAVQLYGEVSKVLKDFPQLCDEFVAFLMPDQAMECGKLLEYLQFKQMRLFLRKLEIHFDKNPQHFQKILKALAQCQEHIHLGLENVKNIIQPLFRGRAHLMEEFLQLFPSESPSENLMTDYEEIALPDSDGEVDYDRYENITLPEDKHDYGGKTCLCHCHTESQDLKLQKKIRHCIPCGTKFIDGRIYIQTGKSLRPARVVYLNSEKSTQSTCVDHSTEQESVEPTSPCSESSSVSSLSPTDLKDSEEERDVAPQSNYSYGSVSANLPLQSDTVTEDAILTPDTSPSTSEISSDFSGLRSVISHEENVSKVSTSSTSDPEVSTTSQEVDYQSPGKKEGLTLSAKNHLVNEHGEIIVLWTKAADSLILKTCQQLGVTDVAFQIVSHQLGNKSVDEVRERFSELIRLFSAHSNELSGSESETD